MICWHRAPNNDYTPSSLQACTDIIYINIYDEIEVDILQDDRDRDTVIHKQIHRNWIGGIKIPFSSIYFNSRVIVNSFTLTRHIL